MFTLISGNLVKFLVAQPRVLKRLVETQKEGPNLGTIIGSPITHIKISATELRANGQDHTARSQGPPPCAKF